MSFYAILTRIGIGNSIVVVARLVDNVASVYSATATTEAITSSSLVVSSPTVVLAMRVGFVGQSYLPDCVRERGGTGRCFGSGRICRDTWDTDIGRGLGSSNKGRADRGGGEDREGDNGATHVE